jgi:hypothetical protein
LRQPTDFALGAGDSLIMWVVNRRLAELQQRLPRTRLQVFNARSSEIGRRLGDFRLDFG